MKNILFFGGASLLSNIWSEYWRDKFNIIIGVNKRLIKINGTKTIQLPQITYDIESIIHENDIDLLINCAGLTGVEDCEREPNRAYELNGYLPGKLAQITSKNNVKLIHISTDHLFNGRTPKSTENVKANPLNIYAKSKYIGEQEVLKYNDKALVIRTNFFGNGPDYKFSFSDKIIDSLLNKQKLYLFDNVYYTPIHVHELSDLTLQLLNKDAFGIYNICSNERITKYEFGVRIAKKLNLNHNLIVPIKIEEKKDLVLRPKDMSLDNEKLSIKIEKEIKSLDNQISELIKNSKIGFHAI